MVVVLVGVVALVIKVNGKVRGFGNDSDSFGGSFLNYGVCM